MIKNTCHVLFGSFAIACLMCTFLAAETRSQSSTSAPDMPKPKTSSPTDNRSDSEQVTPQQHSDVVNPDGSTITGNRYSNPFFGFTFDFPNGWVVHENAAAKKSMEETKKKMIEEHPNLATEANKPDVSAPLLAVSEPTAYKNNDTARTLKILASDVGGEKHPGTAVDYLNAMAAMAKEGKLPFEFLSTPEAITINGKKLGKAYAKMLWEGKTYCVATYAFPYGEYMLQFMITSPEKDGLADLEPAMQSLRFGATTSHH